MVFDYNHQSSSSNDQESSRAGNNRVVQDEESWGSGRGFNRPNNDQVSYTFNHGRRLLHPEEVEAELAAFNALTVSRPKPLPRSGRSEDDEVSRHARMFRNNHRGDFQSFCDNSARHPKILPHEEDEEDEPRPRFASTLRMDFQNELMHKKLDCLTRFNGYTLTQINGQRIYEPTGELDVDPPLKGTEVFIGRICKNIFEDELIPLFESVAPLFRFRLMMTFTEKTRGYAFATYYSQAAANLAISKLNGYEIRKNVRIGVYKSLDNCRLFFGNIPFNKTKHDLHMLLASYNVSVVDIIMCVDYDNREWNRGFAFVEFDSHRSAAMARSQFTPANLVDWGQPLYVHWAEPLPVVNSVIMNKVTVLYVKNVPSRYNSREFHHILTRFLDSDNILKVCKLLNYAFIHMVNRKTAEHAMEQLHGRYLDGQAMHVEWARPRQFSKKNRANQAPNHFCTSVPPALRKVVEKNKEETFETYNRRDNRRSDQSRRSRDFGSPSGSGSSSDSFDSFYENARNWNPQNDGRDF